MRPATVRRNCPHRPSLCRWDSGSEAMLYSDGPIPRQGITDQRNEYMLAERAVGGQVSASGAQPAVCSTQTALRTTGRAPVPPVSCLLQLCYRTTCCACAGASVLCGDGGERHVWKHDGGGRALCAARPCPCTTATKTCGVESVPCDLHLRATLGNRASGRPMRTATSH